MDKIYTVKEVFKIKRYKKFFGIIGVFFIIFTITIFNYIPVYTIHSENQKKVVYLTFDDGPTPNVTKEILNILNRNSIKGTFFIVGSNARENKEILKRLHEDDMCIMPHADLHEYDEIFKSVDDYFKDLNNCQKTISSIIGKENFKFIRIPGGSDNSNGSPEVIEEIKNKIKSENRYYIDWTVDSGDTEEQSVSVNFISSRIREYGGLYPVEVVLMHDIGGKETTIASLQYVIDFYKERGYEFNSLDNIEDSELEYLKKIKVINK